MCGRFTQMMSWSQVHDLYHYQEPAAPLSLTPRYNGAPTQDFAACRLDEACRRTVVKLCWGLVPSWAKDVRMGFRLINARAETVHSKPSFGAAFRSRRCLVPANGWFEWRRDGRNKQPYFLALGRRFSPVVRRGVGALEQPGGNPRNLYCHHHGGRFRTCGHPSPSTRHRRPRPIRRLARSVIVGDQAPRPGPGALRRPLREARGQHQGEQRPEQPSGHPGPGARAEFVLKSMAKPQSRLRRPMAAAWERRLSCRRPGGLGGTESPRYTFRLPKGVGTSKSRRQESRLSQWATRQLPLPPGDGIVASPLR